MISAVLILRDLIFHAIRVCHGSAGLYLTGFVDYICLSVNGDFLVLHSFFRTHKASVLVETSVLHTRESVASLSDTA